MGSELSQFDFYGNAVQLNGDLAAISDPRDQANGSSGAVYIHKYDPKTEQWNEIQVVRASDGMPSDRFGEAMAMTDEYLVIGADSVSTQGSAAGAVYVFRKDAGLFSQIQKLLPSDVEAADLFGGAVAVDGDRIMVGAVGDDDASFNAGAVYLFDYDRENQVWAQSGKLTASDASEWDNFGSSLSVHGNTLLVGATHFNPITSPGKAYAFTYEPLSGTWSEQQLHALTPGLAIRDRYGISVAVDRDLAVVGADRDDNAQGQQNGAVYIYECILGQWVLTETLHGSISFASDGDNFGSSVDLEGDLLVVGSRGALTSGRAYLFRKDALLDRWTEIGRLSPFQGVVFLELEFGHSVSISSGRVLVGMPEGGTAAAGGEARHFIPWVHSDHQNISAAAGGCTHFVLDFPFSEAGSSYGLLGSATGPGSTIVGGVEVMLFHDKFFQRMRNGNAPAQFTNPYGALDNSGDGSILLTVAPGELAALVGKRYFFSVLSYSGALGRLSSWPVALTVSQ